MEKSEWIEILKENPDRASECDVWDEFDGADWSSLLIVQPCFAEKCDWDKLVYRGFGLGGRMGWWVALLSVQPQFADKCDFSRFDKWEWKELLQVQPGLADMRDWDRLDGGDWADLLVECPQFSERCNWDKLSGDDWVSLLSEQPKFADKCDWIKIGWDSFRALKESHPEFAEHQVWNPDVFVCYSDSGRSIATTICDRLNDEWFLATSGSLDSSFDEINSCGVVMPVLTADFDTEFLKQVKVPIVPVWPNNESRRSFGEDVPEQSTLDMTGTDFELSLAKACRRFPKEILIKRDFVASKIECGRIDEAIREYPEYLFGKCPIDIQPRDWVAVLGKHPELSFVCDLSKLDGDDWQVLLCRQPSLGNLCDWSLFNHESWCYLLRWQPQFASKCDFSGFTGEDWKSLLELQPQFGNR